MFVNVWWDLCWKACVCSSQRELRLHYMSDIVCILQDHYCWLTEYSQLCLKSKLMEKSQKVLSKTLAGFSGASSSTEENDKSNQKLQAVWGLKQEPEARTQGTGWKDWVQCLHEDLTIPPDGELHTSASESPSQSSLTDSWAPRGRAATHSHSCRPLMRKNIILFFFNTCRPSVLEGWRWMLFLVCQLLPQKLLNCI